MTKEEIQKLMMFQTAKGFYSTMSANSAICVINHQKVYIKVAYMRTFDYLCSA